MFRQKIKTREELAKAIGKPPRSKSVIMCHGVFDIVHPGHLRHLMYAKEKADILVASITADAHINKLLSLMDSEGVDFADLKKAVRSLAGIKVHVVGDTIVDGYSACTLLGAAAKYPTFSVKLERTELFTGGAGIVARHVKAAGADVEFSTVLGDDGMKDFALKELEASGVVCQPAIDRTRPTTYKERFTADGHKLLQVDRVDNRPISDKILKVICESLRGSQADVFIMSDFRHG